jgi:hypothetical protein
VETGVQQYDAELIYWIPAPALDLIQGRRRNDEKSEFRTFYDFIKKDELVRSHE